MNLLRLMYHNWLVGCFMLCTDQHSVMYRPTVEIVGVPNISGV